MAQRQEFERGPSSDYLQSLFHILQQTGNEDLLAAVEKRIDQDTTPQNAETARSLMKAMETGQPIEGCLSDCHYGIPHANFTRGDVLAALDDAKRDMTDGSQLIH